MHLLRLFKRDEFKNIKDVFWLSIISGAANVALLTSINDALRHIMDVSRGGYMLAVFLSSSLLLWLSQRLLMKLFTVRFSAAADLFRASLLRRTLAADGLEMTDLGRHHVGLMLSRTFDVILEAAPAIVVCAHCVVEIVFGLIYLFVESPLSVALALPLLGTGAAIIVVTGLRLNALRARLQEMNTQLEDHSQMIVSGLRESRINAWRAFRVYEEFAAKSSIIRNQRSAANDMFIMNFASAELIYFAIGGVMVFIVPSLMSILQIDLIFAANAASFMAYPTLLIALFSLSLVDASEAAREIADTEARLPDGEWRVTAPAAETVPVTFSRLTLADACFHYPRQDNSVPFSVGPVDLHIDRSEIVFITGINGTGKSTLLHMLLALYPLATGSISLDGTVITQANLQWYYRLFSVVFPDYHLTEQIVGIDTIDADLAAELLELFEIGDKVSIVDGRFSTISLSHGQRKRLALIAALLEKRPVIVLDEWAADQAPAFRWTFYKRILPWIKARGGTVIAITHDDAYFDVADVHITIENGKICEYTRK